jgi:hypothetical protein
MKRLSKTLVAALIIVATTAAFMAGCKKEQDAKLSDNGQIEQNDKSAETAIARITDFKKQVDVRKAQPGMKSAETVSINEAVADIVELFNAVYAQPENFYVQMVRNSFTINLPLTSEGKVLVDDVVSAYNQAIVQARQAYINDGINDDKGYVGLTVQLGNITNDTAELVFFSTSGQSGDCATPSTSPNGPFDEYDDWMYKAPMGKCVGTCIGLGADTVLRQMIASVCYDWGRDPVTGQRYYYYDYHEYDFDGCDYPDWLFYRQGIMDLCIQYDEMNSLFYSTKQFLELIGPDDMGLPMSGSNRFYLKMDFSIEGNPNPTEDDFLSHNIKHVHYARRTLYPSETIKPGNLMDD